jgi:hypothetical protein
VTRDAVFMLLVCTGLGTGRLLATSATVALVPHFETPLGQQILPWIAPTIAEAFQPAGLSVEWYKNRDAAPGNAARTVDVWFRGDCWPMTARNFRGSSWNSIRLGWVRSQNGHIGDDINVDCAAVMQLAAEARSATTNRALLDVVLLRLVEHVVAHELLHILLMSASHGHSDFSSPHMQASDWRRIGRLTHAEVQSLRKSYGPEASVTWAQHR